MPPRKLLPAEVEPDAIGDLIDDCHELPGAVSFSIIDLTGIPLPRHEPPGVIVIPDGALSLVDGYAEYGA